MTPLLIAKAFGYEASIASIIISTQWYLVCKILKHMDLETVSKRDQLIRKISPKGQTNRHISPYICKGSICF
ncbi:hypothetical protein ASF32_10775 [Methylobacterium sp. Leaf91]|nr:hypothetical protein ASF24_14345 [Methylobacterium sp. Leaf86]KQO85698.1 hypothetical protein ASF32_10775 [Methylobacterium sp. Leaf91]